MGNHSNYGGNWSLQYIQTNTQSLVFSSPTPLVGFYNIAPSQHQPCSGVTHSPPVPGITTSSRTATLFFVCHQHFFGTTSFFPVLQAFNSAPQPALLVSSGNRCPSPPSGHWDALHPLSPHSHTCILFFLRLKDCQLNLSLGSLHLSQHCSQPTLGVVGESLSTSQPYIMTSICTTMSHHAATIPHFICACTKIHHHRLQVPSFQTMRVSTPLMTLYDAFSIYWSCW